MSAAASDSGGERIADAANVDRFTGFADLYDANRPTAPEPLGGLLLAYAGVDTAAVVVDLGSGTGLSSRWASTWAASVIGIEPNDDMRGQAASHGGAHVTYQRGHSQATGLADNIADIVLAVQAMHWMDPEPTLSEVARLLRPGGVFAVIDADWPPVCGVVDAELAWATMHRRMRVFEARGSRHETGAALRRPIDEDDPALGDDDLHDPHRNRAMPGGIRSWSKSGHLDRMVASGHFFFTRELVFNEQTHGGAERFIALLQSQGGYQSLLRLGLDELDLGTDRFESEVRAAFAAAASPRLSFSWRVRLGVTPR